MPACRGQRGAEDALLMPLRALGRTDIRTEKQAAPREQGRTLVVQGPVTLLGAGAGAGAGFDLVVRRLILDEEV